MRRPGEDRVGESCWGDCWRERSELRVRGSTEGCLRWEELMDWEETGIPGGAAEHQHVREDTLQGHWDAAPLWACSGRVLGSIPK